MLMLFRGFPGWVAEGGTSPYTNSTVRYILKWLIAARDIHKIHIDYLGIWNEHSWNRDYIVSLKKAMIATGLTTKIVAPDGGWNVCDAMLLDMELYNAVDIVGAHYVGELTTSSCNLLGPSKPLWASEDFSANYTHGGCWSRLLNRNYVFGNMTTTIAWNLIASYYSELPYSEMGLMLAISPWSGHYEVSQVIWATAHTTQFVDVGWHYLQHGSGVGALENNGSYVALTDGKELTIVVESMTPAVSDCSGRHRPPGNVTSQQVTFQLAGAFAGLTALNVFFSDFHPGGPETWFEYQGTISVSQGKFSFFLDIDQIYTFSTRNGTKNMYPTPPVASPFPPVYSDSFDTYTLSSEAAYFTDQTGSFEIVKATDVSHGLVMRQMVPQRPVSWCYDAEYPYSVIGDHNWRKINVSVDILIETRGAAMLAADVTSGGCAGDHSSPAIAFFIHSDGNWTLSNNTTPLSTLASGSIDVPVNTWHHMQLYVLDDRSEVYFNGQYLGMTTILNAKSSKSGWAAIGSSFDYVQFDNFNIMVTPPSEYDQLYPLQTSHSDPLAAVA